MKQEKQPSKPRNRYRIRSPLPLWVPTLVAVILLCGWPALGQQNELCFPSTTWFGAPAPTIDGKVYGDPGWQGAFRYVFGNGTSNPDAVVQGIRDSSHLYLSIEADNLPSLTNVLDPSTVVLLTFDVRQLGYTGDPFQNIQLKPVAANTCFNSTCPSPPVCAPHCAQIATDPASITGVNGGPPMFWTGSTLDTNFRVNNWKLYTDPNNSAINAPSWLQPPNYQVGYLQNPSGTYHWYLELQLPISSASDPTASTDGIVVPPTGTFGFYVNVFRVVSGQYQETWWPPTQGAYEQGCSSVGSCTPDSYLEIPPVTTWGKSTIGPQTCNGVSVTSQVNNIFTDHSPNSQISLTNPNNFHAYVQNTSLDPTGNPIAAQQVRATFKIANFGLPSLGSWSKVPTDFLAHFKITQTSMTAGTATYSWSLWSGTAPTAGQTPVVTVIGTNNGAGIFNVTNARTSNWSGTTSGTFQVAGFTGSPTIAAMVDAGSAIVSDLNITQTSMTAGTATYSWSLPSGTAPTAGQTPVVTVIGTNNGAGVFNVTDAQTSNWSGTTSGTFQVAGFPGSPTIAATFETGFASVTLNPSPYKDIPASNAATNCKGAANNGNAACILSVGPWNLTAQQQTDYAAANMEHQCILVELDSSPTSTCAQSPPVPAGCTSILNNAAVQNMDFVPASKFQRTAEISAKGYPPRPDNPDGTHNPGQLFDLHVISRQEVLKSGQTSTSNVATTQEAQNREPEKGRVVSQLTWIAHGCRHTGRFFTVDERKIEVCDPVGAFGYVIRHRGKSKVKDWKLQFTGANLTRVPGQPNTYQIRIPQDGVATVTTHAEPEEQGVGKLAVFLDAGAGIPHGTFGNTFNTGFSLNAGLEYMATSRFSAEGIFGYHRFTAKVGGGALNLYQFSVNGKAYLTSGGSLRPFISAGVGGYHFSPANTYFGGNVGAGLLKELTSHWSVKVSYNFHAVNTPGAATKFSTVQGGIRFVF